MKRTYLPTLLVLISLWTSPLTATRLLDIQTVDDQCLVIHWQDGKVEYNWDDLTSGSCNGWDYYHTEDWHLCDDKDQYIPFGEPLDTAAATKVTSFLLSSDGDTRYGSEGKRPTAVYRKSKVWEASHDERKPAMHHWIYLSLPYSLKNGTPYMLTLDAATQTDLQHMNFIFDEAKTVSPSIRISNTGYERTAPHKFADVYMWMGDGGGRDFKRLEGTPWHLVDVRTGISVHSGKMAYRMANRKEPKFGENFTMADIWECDFSDYEGPGLFKLVIDGIGSSKAFPIGDNQFEEPFKVAMQGMFYQRMGCDDEPAGGFPKARRPLYRQGVEPEGFTVRISNYDMVTGPNPDNRDHYGSSLTGGIAAATWGGWCDAYDNDQRPVNFICVFDLLLTYYLSPASFRDTQLYIPETGNGIPDILDEALWEIDWWLRMRDTKGGYLTGLTNIKPPENVNYAGAPCAWQGWCVAAGSAMVADCFRLAGMPDKQAEYLQHAIEAYEWAQSQVDAMLDSDVQGLRGRDLKMTAAAFLYNLTGKKEYADIIESESVVSGPKSRVRLPGQYEQQFATIGYIQSPYPTKSGLRENMVASIMHQARTDYLHGMQDSPTLAVRHAQGWEGMMQTSNEVSIVAIAHHLSDDTMEKESLAKGLYAEAEWTLGRNPLGLVQMTGLSEDSITQTFAPGRRDGFPGLTPGWTPYMCRDGWNNGDDIHRCEWYTNRNYPADKELWPYGEHFWNSRYSVPNSETTPQQTFRQKIVLYGYLFAMNH